MLYIRPNGIQSPKRQYAITSPLLAFFSASSAFLFHFLPRHLHVSVWSVLGRFGSVPVSLSAGHQRCLILRLEHQILVGRPLVSPNVIR
jgi:hypothetical protein